MTSEMWPQPPSLIRHLLDPDEIDEVIDAADDTVKAYLLRMFPDDALPSPTIITRQEALMAVLIAQLANVHAQLYEMREVLHEKAGNQ